MPFGLALLQDSFAFSAAIALPRVLMFLPEATKALEISNSEKMKKFRPIVPLISKRTAAISIHPGIGPQKFWRKARKGLAFCSFNSFVVPRKR